MKSNFKLLLLLILLVIGCKTKETDPASAETEEESEFIIVSQKQFEASNFRLGQIEEKTFPRTIEATGTVVIPQKYKAVVSTLLSGQVGPLNLNEGQWVRKGDHLFDLTNPELIDLQEDYIKSREKLEFLTHEYNRKSQLVDENLIKRNSLHEISYELESTKAEKSALEKKLSIIGLPTQNLTSETMVSQIAVRAPISGYLSRILVSEGMTLDTDHDALYIDNTYGKRIAVDVLPHQASLIKPGNRVRFFLDGSDGQEIMGTVRSVNHSVSDNQLFTVYCDIAGDRSKRLLSGMIVDAQLSTDNAKGPALPVSAVIKKDNKYWILKEDHKSQDTFYFSRYEVPYLAEIDGYFAIDTSVNMSGQYLVQGAYLLIE